jgi:hypothetical protein
MGELGRWSAVSESVIRFHQIERVVMVSFEMCNDRVRVYVVVVGDKSDEVLRNELMRVEEGIVRDFPWMKFEFCYETLDEVMGKRRDG